MNKYNLEAVSGTSEIFYKNILVISDNEELSFFANKILTELEGNLKVTYGYSSINKNPQKMIELGAYSLNLKEEVVVSDLISNFDLVISMHCKQIFPKILVSKVKCINFHPGYNPHNRGWFPQAFSIVNGLPVGVSVHVMDEFIDHGLIIAQETVNICFEDTSYEAYRKIIDLEKKMIAEHMQSIILNSYSCVSPSGEGNYNSMKDYQQLCKLNLSSMGTLGEHINLLRATTHKGFNNAYYIDSDNEKYYIEIKITKDHY